MRGCVAIAHPTEPHIREPSEAERIENVVHAALDYIAEKGWLRALGYHARLGRGAFTVSTQQEGDAVGEPFVGYPSVDSALDVKLFSQFQPVSVIDAQAKPPPQRRLPGTLRVSRLD